MLKFLLKFKRIYKLRTLGKKKIIITFHSYIHSLGFISIGSNCAKIKLRCVRTSKTTVGFKLNWETKNKKGGKKKHFVDESAHKSASLCLLWGIFDVRREKEGSVFTLLLALFFRFEVELTRLLSTCWLDDLAGHLATFLPFKTRQTRCLI